MKNYLTSICLSIVICMSCTTQDDGSISGTDDDTADLGYQNALLVTNEGPFNEGVGTVDALFRQTDTTFEVVRGVYEIENQNTLGNILQSAGFHDDKVYFVSNVSARINVVDALLLKEEGVIENGLDNPRYFVGFEGTGFVSNWGDPTSDDDDFVAVINLSTLEVVDTIAVPSGPEELILINGFIYVAHQGGFGINNLVTVIDASAGTIVETLEVGEVPNSLALDEDGNLWVLSGGNPGFIGTETGGVLTKIDTNTQSVVESYAFDTSFHPNYLNSYNGALYFYESAQVFTGTTAAFELPESALFSTGFLYNMTIIDDELFGCNPGDFASDGTVEIYDMPSGTLKTTVEVGIIPGNVYPL